MNPKPRPDLDHVPPALTFLNQGFGDGGSLSHLAKITISTATVGPTKMTTKTPGTVLLRVNQPGGLDAWCRLG